jgi:cytochrome c oxidase cbb3-type subunit 3
VVFALVYLVFYPGLGSYSGLGQWSGQGQHRSDVQRMRAELAPLYARFTATPIDQLSRDPQALAIGQRHFMNHCAQCHGSDARGSKGYPNLTQGPSAWLGPLSGEHIVQTISQGRQGVMPAMGAAIGGEAAMSDLAHYVLSFSGSPHNEIKAFSGKKHYAACAACHGADGKGNKALGAPNLADNYWLHGWGEAAIVSIIKNGKSNVMPAQSAWLSPEQIHVLAAYVLSLSGPAPGTVGATALPARTP